MYTYNPLFSVECHHGYYSRGISPDLAYVPTPGCQALMKNYGLFFRPERQGFYVLYKTQDQGKHLLELGEETLKFTFYIKNRNYLFGSFSELPFAENEQVYHFQNIKAKGKGDLLTLHQGEKASGEDLLRLVQPMFQYTLDPKRMPKKVSLKDALGAPVGGILDAQKTLVEEYVLPSSDLNVLTMNLRDEAPGRFTLLFDGKPELAFYAAEVSPMECFGVLDIYFGGPESKGYELKQNGALASKAYRLDFDARATIWKYYLITDDKGQGFQPVKILELVNGKKIKEIPFSQPQSVQMNTGAEALLMASKTPMHLSQLPRKLLLEYTLNGESGLQLDLPNPDATQVKPDPEGKADAFCSEMFVYV